MTGVTTSPTFRSLANPNYRLYAAGGVVSNTGTWMQRVAQDWLVLQLAGSAGGTALGITTGLQFLPFLIFTPLAGVVADRMPKQRLLQLTNLGMAVPAVALAGLALTGAAELWHVYVLAFLLGTASAFDAPARQSFVSELVDPTDLSNAVGLNSASFNAARLVGPGLAGLLIAALGGGVSATGWVIAFNAVSYAAPIWTLRRLDAGLLDSPALVERRRGAVLEGVAYVRARPDLVLVLAIVFFAGTFGLNFQITSALMATEVFGKGAGEFGLLGSFLAIGSLTGALLAARRPVVRLRLVVGSALVFGATVFLAGTMPTYVTFAVLTPLTGLSALTLITSANTYMQLNTEAGVRGRVMALYLMVFMGGTPVGAPLIGWIGEEWGARWTLLGGGLLTIGGVALAGLAFLGRGRLTLTAVPAPSSLVPRVWDDQAIARAQK
ncbi:MFS transporter [Nocardioides seonyuensis]|uniref:MFS transporter n=1 Tax=Nocardioides seonyuensis TaxID=2518371 RepID=A0A4P7IMA9_9ACTN|nr:MFS transporter [Nocardioides seonyuensis]